LSPLRRLLVLPIAAAAVFVAAGCALDSGGVPSNAIAVVGEQTVTKSELDLLLDQARANARESRRSFPKPGTAEYRQIRAQVVQYLVRRAQLAAEAEARDIEVSNEEIEQRRKLVVKQYFGGNEDLYRKQLEKTGGTEEQARADIEARLIQEALFKDVGKDVKVSDAEMRRHYRKSKVKYSTPAQREIRHILVKAEQGPLARRLVSRLRSGVSFGRLARRYSQDPRSKNAGGRIVLSKGQAGAALEKVAFSIPAHTLSDPIRTRFGWHVVEALGPLRPGTTRPYRQVKEAIREELLQTKKNEASTKYLVRLARKNKVKYQAGFGPRA
jgi:parvulin-like peptidyl-prolyl isomerase